MDIQNEFLMMGYIAMSLGSRDAEILFRKYTGDGDLRSIIRCQDASYRRNTHSDVVLDYHIDEKGTVVQQTMWRPAQGGDVRRHVLDADLLPPIFFIRTDYVKGVDMSHVRSGGALNIFHPNTPAHLGGRATTFLILKWPGYAQEFSRQVEIRDGNRAPITMSKLVERVTKFVGRFFEEAAGWPIDPSAQQWRVGPGAITADHLYLIGLIHISAGKWQPILQLKHLNWP